MLPPTSLKDLSRAIQAFLSQPKLPLPSSLLDVLARYLERHERDDDAASDRLQEELLATFDKHVKGNVAVFGPWIAILRRLLPALKTPERILPWFDIYKGLLDNAGVDKHVVDEAVAALVDLVAVADACHTSSDLATNPIVDRLLSIWMTRFYPSLAEGGTNNEYNERIIRQAIKGFGKKWPTALFMSMDVCFVRKAFRHATLRLFCDFIQDQPPHLHQVLHTSLFSNLLMCLQHDTSKTVISSALTVLIMLLPHMPSSLVPHLPTLFNIYARLLFWDREMSRLMEAPLDNANQHVRGLWDVCAHDPEMDDSSMPLLCNYYTILYGLYPINFMDYIRKPQRYLRHANMSDPEEIEVQPTEIRHRSERFRRCHLLHPNFYTLTIDSEKTDFGRWIKSEAAEVLVECMALCRATDDLVCTDGRALPPIPGADVVRTDNPSIMGAGGPDPLVNFTGKLDSRRSSQLSDTGSGTSNVTPLLAKRRGSQSSQLSDRHGKEQDPTVGWSTDSPTMPSNSLQSSSQDWLQDLIRSNKDIKSGFHQSLENESVLSLSLSHREIEADKTATAASSVVASASAAATGSSSCATALGTQLAHLQRRVLVLENDLNFERYVKQQHMAHIGELRRRQVVEAATEAETQNLVMMNRNLKGRFEEAKKAERQVRKESEKGRALAKKWESDLARKLKHLRDESKMASAELGALGRELCECKQECEKLRKLVCEAEVKELNWVQSMQSKEIQEAEMSRLKKQIEELTKAEHHQMRDSEWKAALSSAQAAEAQVELMKRGLVAQEHDAKRARSMLQAQVTALQTLLANAQGEHERPGLNTNLIIESAFAASRAKQAALQRQYNLLMRKYTALQSSLLDMHSETMGESSGTQEPHAPGSEYWPMSPGSAAVAMARPHLSASENEGMAYNVTPPLASHSGTPASSEIERRGSAPEGFSAGAIPLGAGDARYFGSGLPSRARMDSRDKAGRDDASATGKPKKEKKSSGLRGIRGFV